jgi:hypothetical protein
LSDREVQPFDEGCVQFRGVFGIGKHLLQSPAITNYHSSLDLHNTVVPSGFYDLAIQTSESKDTADDHRIKGESVCGDQKDTFEIRSAGDISEKGECVPIPSSPHDCRMPKGRPDLDRGEDPDGFFLVVDDGTHLICLKLCDGDSRYFSIVKPATKGSGFFQPVSHRVPCDSLYARDCGLVQTLNTQGSNFVKGRSTVLEPMVWATGIRAECLSASPALVATPLPPLGLIEAVADDASGSVHSRCALKVWTPETHHCSLTVNWSPGIESRIILRR